MAVLSADQKVEMMEAQAVVMLVCGKVVWRGCYCTVEALVDSTVVTTAHKTAVKMVYRAV